MSRSGYDAVVDVDDEVLISPPFLSLSLPYTNLFLPQGDLGHTDLREDLEFHQSNFSSTTNLNKPSGLPLPATASSSAGGQSGGKKLIWTLGFYSQFFDVDTTSVLQRCWAALFPRANFLDVLEGNPDLYGPFWIATTVVLILFLGGTISDYLASTGRGNFAYDFRLLSGMFFDMIYGGVEKDANLTNDRRRWVGLRVHDLHPGGSVSCAEVLWVRVG